MTHQISVRLAILVIAAVWLATGGPVGCGGDSNPSQPAPSLSAAELTARGWTRFAAGDLTAALSDFDAAIARDGDHAPAHVGQGWARLGLATAPAAMGNAVASFDAASGLGEGGAETLAGRAAAHLGSGGASLALAAADAAAARQAAPQFEFAHRPSFDHRDLLLIEAFARAGQDDLAAALMAADAVAPSGITVGDGASWVVDGQTYGSFGAAVLAYLHKLSAAHAG